MSFVARDRWVGVVFAVVAFALASCFAIRSVWISTVWLGLDHNLWSGGPPLIYETMVFPGGTYRELYCERYATEEQARAGHERAVRWARWHG